MLMVKLHESVQMNESGNLHLKERPVQQMHYVQEGQPGKKLTTRRKKREGTK